MVPVNERGTPAARDVATAIWAGIWKIIMSIMGKKSPPPLPVIVASIPIKNPISGNHKKLCCKSKLAIINMSSN